MTASLPVDADFFRDPFPVFDRLRNRGPIHRLRRSDGVDRWIVVGTREIQDGLGDPRLSKDPDLIAEALCRQRLAHGADPVAARADVAQRARFTRSFTSHVRAVVADTLRPALAERRTELLTACADGVLDGLDDLDSAAGPVDLVRSYALPYAIRMTGILLCGTETAKFVEPAAEWLSPTTTGTRGMAAEQLMAHLGDMAARNEGRQDDVISALAGRICTDGHGHGELALACMVFTTISVENTYSALATAVHTLLTHPDHLDLLAAHPKRIPHVVDELLRIGGPHNVSGQRCATEDLVLGGQLVEEGDLVVFALGAANHDPAVHSQPRRFDPNRPAGRHLAFGTGRHHCPAAHQARSAVAIALTALLRRFPELRLAVAPEEVPWQASETLRAVGSLPVRLRCR